MQCLTAKPCWFTTIAHPPSNNIFFGPLIVNSNLLLLQEILNLTGPTLAQKYRSEHNSRYHNQIPSPASRPTLRGVSQSPYRHLLPLSSLRMHLCAKRYRPFLHLHHLHAWMRHQEVVSRCDCITLVSCLGTATRDRPRSCFPRYDGFSFDMFATRRPPHYGARIRSHIIEQPVLFRCRRRMFEIRLHHRHSNESLYLNRSLPHKLPGPFISLSCPPLHQQSIRSLTAVIGMCEQNDEDCQQVRIKTLELDRACRDDGQWKWSLASKPAIANTSKFTNLRSPSANHIATKSPKARNTGLNNRISTAPRP